MKNLSYLLLALSLAAFWSCSSAQDEITSLLPPSTIGYIQLNSPEGLLADAETMMTDLGLAGILQGESIQDLAEGFLQSEGAPFSIADLNLTKPIGMAAIGPATVGDEPILRTFIPSSNPQKLLEAYNSEVPSLQRNEGQHTWFLLGDRHPRDTRCFRKLRSQQDCHLLGRHL
jgi:hypothetical protein